MRTTKVMIAGLCLLERQSEPGPEGAMDVLMIDPTRFPDAVNMRHPHRPVLTAHYGDVSDFGSANADPVPTAVADSLADTGGALVVWRIPNGEFTLTTEDPDGTVAVAFELRYPAGEIDGVPKADVEARWNPLTWLLNLRRGPGQDAVANRKWVAASTRLAGGRLEAVRPSLKNERLRYRPWHFDNGTTETFEAQALAQAAQWEIPGALTVTFSVPKDGGPVSKTITFAAGSTIEIGNLPTPTVAHNRGGSLTHFLAYYQAIGKPHLPIPTLSGQRAPGVRFIEDEYCPPALLL